MHTTPPPTAASGLVFGWQTDARRSTIGFSPAAQNPCGQRPEPFIYSGGGHILTCGRTGGDKSRGAVIPNLLWHDGPTVVVDVGGELTQITARRRREVGHRVIVLDPFRVTTDTPDRFNPLDLLTLPGSDAGSDAWMIANLIAEANPFVADRTPDTAVTSLIATVIGSLGRVPPAHRTLNAVRDLLYSIDLDAKLATALNKNEVASRFVRDGIVAYLSAPADSTRLRVRGAAMELFRTLGGEGMVGVLGPSTFDLTGVVRGDPLSIYLVFPVTRLDSHRSLLRVWLGTLLTTLAGRTVRPARRTLVMIDEAAALGPLPQVQRAVSLFRGRGVQLWTVWQDLSQLRHLYPSDWPTLVNNCGVLHTCGIGTPLAADEWAAVLGCPAAVLLREPDDRAQVYVGGDGYRSLRQLDYTRDCAGLFDRYPRSSPTRGCGR